MPSSGYSRAAQIAAFECRLQHASRAAYALAVVTLLLGVALIATDTLSVGSVAVARNGTFALAMSNVLIAIALLVIGGAIPGVSLQRDFDLGVTDLLGVALPGTGGHVLGRWLGGVGTLLAISALAPVGMAIGASLRDGSNGVILPVGPAGYLWPWLCFGAPTVIFGGTLSFTVGALTRRAFAVYVTGMILLVAAGLMATLGGASAEQGLASVLDPFGFVSLTRTAQYWDDAEKSRRAIPLAGALLFNRALMLTLSAALLALVVSRFSLARRSAARGGGAAIAKPEPSVRTPAAHARVVPSATLPSSALQLLALTRLSLTLTLRSTLILAMVFVGIANLLATVTFADLTPDGRVYPFTSVMVEAIATGALPMLIIITTIIAGENAARDRNGRVDQLVDTMPVADWVHFTARLLGTVLVQLILLAALAATGMVIQLAKGFSAIEPGLYLQYLGGIVFPVLVQAALLATAVHAMVRRPAAGHAVILGLWATALVLRTSDLPQQVTKILALPPVTYSDLSGFGPSATNALWHALWWVPLSAVIALGAFLLAPRGRETLRGGSLRRVQQRLTIGPRLCVIAIAMVLAVSGSVMLRETVLRPGLADIGWRSESVRARYEREFGALAALPMPTLAAVDARIDIEPEQRRVHIRTAQLYKNESQQAVTTLLVHLPIGALTAPLQFDRPSQAGVDDLATGVRVIRFVTPIVPGDSVRMTADIALDETGFRDDRPDQIVLSSGTVLSTETMFPLVGYQSALELRDTASRRRVGLPTQPPPSTVHARGSAARLRFDVTTAANQTVVGPGRVVRDTLESGRRHTVFEQTTPGPADFAIVSGNYVVRRIIAGQVPIEVYAHPTHTINQEQMLRVAAASLTDYIARFGPYSLGALRIVEIPRFMGGAQSLPGLILFGEGLGFMLRAPDDSSNINLPAFVTAHEVAHQWFGNQIVASAAAPAGLVTEGMAQFAAYDFTSRWAPASLPGIKAYEANRYFLGRAVAGASEIPLRRVDRDGYLMYSKALLSFASVGHAALFDGAARALVDSSRGIPRRATTNAQLLAQLRGALPSADQARFTALFDSVVTEEVSLTDVRATPRADGNDDLLLSIAANRVAPASKLPMTSVRLSFTCSGVGSASARDTIITLPAAGPVPVRAPCRVATVRVDGFLPDFERDRDDNTRAVQRRASSSPAKH